MTWSGIVIRRVILLSFSFQILTSLLAGQSQLPAPGCPTAGGNNQHWWTDIATDPVFQLKDGNGVVIGIHIPANQRVYLNTTPTTPIPILWIEGELVFDECHGVMDFPAGAILVDGNLQIGTAQNPYTVDASVTFSDLTLPTDTQLIEAGISDAAARAALLDYTARNAPLTVFPGARGTLDAFGDATATATFAPGQAAAWAGRTIRFSAVTLAAPGDAGNYSAGMRVSIVN